MFKCCTLEVFNITEHVQGIQYLLHCWCSNCVLYLNTCSWTHANVQYLVINKCSSWWNRSVPGVQTVFFPLNTMVFNITEHVQGVQYLLQFWRSDGVLNLYTHFYSVVFDLFCIFRENTHEQQLSRAKILYQCPSRNILDFVYDGSHFSTGVIFLRVRHVKNRPLWHFFYTRDTFFYGQGSFLYDEKWPLGRFSTGVVIRRYTGIKLA